MKIIIVGGGIAACSTYLFFRQTFAQDPAKYEIKIYEKHAPRAKVSSSEDEPDSDSQDLEELSTSTAIVGGGLGISPNGARILSEISQDLYDDVAAQGFPCEKFIFRASRGWKLSETPSTDGRGHCCIASSRHGLWRCLSKAVGADAIEIKKVVRVIPRAGHQCPKVLFKDGGEEVADLIIGADGVKSVVKDGIFSESEYRPIYELVPLLLPSTSLIV